MSEPHSHQLSRQHSRTSSQCIPQAVQSGEESGLKRPACRSVSSKSRGVGDPPVGFSSELTKNIEKSTGRVEKSATDACRSVKKSQAHDILDAMLDAICQVPSFRKLLASHCIEPFADTGKPLLKARIKETIEFKFSELLNSRMRYNPMNFVVKLFEILKYSDGGENIEKGIFSVGVEKTTTCEECKLQTHSAMKFDAIPVLDSKHFDRDFARFFNPEQTVNQQSYFTKKDSNETLQLFFNNLLRPISYNTTCTVCSKETKHKEQTELKPHGSGLIVAWPMGWNAENVSAKLVFKDSQTGRLTFELRAIVLQESSCEEPKPGNWVYAKKIPRDIKQYSDCPLLLFFEKIEIIKSGASTQSKRSSVNKTEQSDFYGQDIRQPHYQPLNLTERLDTLGIARSPSYLRSPTETEESKKFECSGRTAGLEAALRGLFTIRGFTHFLERSHFPSEQFQSVPIFRLLEEMYELNKRQESLTAPLKDIMELLEVEDGLPHQYIISLLNQFDDFVKSESRDVLDQARKDRRNCCGELHDVFSVLVKNRSSVIGYFEKWTYSRMLHIALRSEPAKQRRLQSIEARRISKTVDLEPYIQQMQQITPEVTCFPIWHSHNPQLYYLSSALIIHIHEEKNMERQENFIRVPKKLDLTEFDINVINVFKLRAIVHLQRTELRNSFMVQIIDDYKEAREMLDLGCDGYLLLYEQEQSESRDERAKLVDHFPVIEAKPRIIPNIKTEVRPKREEKITSDKMNFRYGLQNLGNTCFMNSALNGLYSLTSFRSYFTTQQPQDQLMKALLQFCNTHTREQVQSDLLYQFKRAIPEFDDGRQHCANSYIFKLLMLLDTLLPTPSTTTFPHDIFGNKMRQYRKGKCESLHDIFGTLAENLFICKKCSHTRRNFSYFRTVDVPIPYYAKAFGEVTMFSPNNFYPGRFAKEYTGTEVSETEYRQEFLRRSKELTDFKPTKTLSRTDLYECFKYMLRASLMSPQSLMQCDDCGKETQHYKQSFFRQLSTTFVIHFQRFDERDGTKLDTPVDFPMDLDMSDYCVNDPRKYQLCGVVYHFGSLEFGHYTACIKVRGRWYDVNDSSVREVKDKPRSENAYMLFYE